MGSQYSFKQCLKERFADVELRLLETLGRLNGRLPVTESSWRVCTRFLLLGLRPRRLENEEEEEVKEEVEEEEVEDEEEEEDLQTRITRI